MAIWHAACKGETSKFRATDRRVYGQCSICGRPIAVGEIINWTRTAEEGRMRQTTTPAPATTTTAGTAGAGALETMLADLVVARIAPTVDAAIDAKLARCDVDAIVRDAQAAIDARIAGISVPTRIEVVRPDTSTYKLDGVHCQTAQLMQHVLAGVDTWIAGPAGTGKSTALERIAASLDAEFYLCGVDVLNDPSKLFGYILPGTGMAVQTMFRDAWSGGWRERGKERAILVFDDADRVDNSQGPCALNGALANGMCAFPDKCLPRASGLTIAVTANTWGEGATSEYVGSARYDKAFRDRFVDLAWTIDPALERTLAGQHGDWYARVLHVRERVAQFGIKVLITPRATLLGARMLDAGIDRDAVESATLRRGMSAEQWDKVRA